MEALTKEHKRALEAQVQAAYGWQRGTFVSVRNNPSLISKYNRRFRLSSHAALAARIRVENKFIRSMRVDSAPLLIDLMEGMQHNGELDHHAEEAAKLYYALRTPKTPDKVTQERIKEYMSHNRSVRASIRESLRHTSSELDLDWTKPFSNFKAAITMFHFSAAIVLKNVVTHAKSYGTYVILDLQEKAFTGAVFTEADWFQINMILNTFPEVRDAIMSRDNMVKLTGFKDSMFESLRSTIEEKLYKNIEGGAGAKELAKEMAYRLADDHKKLPNIPEHKYELWARTEGAIVQNDALMKLGEESGCNGKIWQAVMDERTREGHALNDAAGVIPVDDVFPDGSTDGGGGSVSPFNCRCSVGPALLPKDKRADRNKPNKK